MVYHCGYFIAMPIYLYIMDQGFPKGYLGIAQRYPFQVGALFIFALRYIFIFYMSYPLQPRILAKL